MSTEMRGLQYILSCLAWTLRGSSTHSLNYSTAHTRHIELYVKTTCQSVHQFVAVLTLFQGSLFVSPQNLINCTFIQSESKNKEIWFSVSLGAWGLWLSAESTMWFKYWHGSRFMCISDNKASLPKKLVAIHPSASFFGEYGAKQLVVPEAPEMGCLTLSISLIDECMLPRSTVSIYCLAPQYLVSLTVKCGNLVLMQLPNACQNCQDQTD